MTSRYLDVPSSGYGQAPQPQGQPPSQQGPGPEGGVFPPGPWADDQVPYDNGGAANYPQQYNPGAEQQPGVGVAGWGWGGAPMAPPDHPFAPPPPLGPSPGGAYPPVPMGAGAVQAPMQAQQAVQPMPLGYVMHPNGAMVPVMAPPPAPMPGAQGQQQQAGTAGKGHKGGHAKKVGWCMMWVDLERFGWMLGEFVGTHILLIREHIILLACLLIFTRRSWIWEQWSPASRRRCVLCLTVF